MKELTKDELERCMPVLKRLMNERLMPTEDKLSLIQIMATAIANTDNGPTIKVPMLSIKGVGPLLTTTEMASLMPLLNLKA